MSALVLVVLDGLTIGLLALRAGGQAPTNGSNAPSLDAGREKASTR